MTAELIPTACNLCYANCGVLVQVEDGHIVKVRGDKAHPVSRGYTCNKAARIDYYQNGRDRLSSPLRRREDGTFEEIDWDTAIAEIAARFAAIRDEHGGDKILYYGGGGQGNHLGGGYSGAVRKALGMRYHSNALAQEKTGLSWTSQRMLGGGWHGDFDECDVALIIGKNPWQSNGIQRARILMRDIAKDPDRMLVVFDPRRSETAEMADVHLAVRPGTDVWCITAILGYIVQNDLANIAWLEEHANDYDKVLAMLADVPVEEYARFAGIPMADIQKVAEAMGATDRIGVYEDLGIEMSPYSTLCSYLNVLLFVIRGSFANEGGMHLVNPLVSIFNFTAPIGEINADGVEENYPVTPVTGARIASGLVPCTVLPEEILNDHPDRFRGILVESSNPVHSLADSGRFREAFEALDTVVVIDVAMTETAMMADYVLPAASQYEKVESTFFNFEYPDNFFHLRQPLFEPRPGTLTEPEMHARLVEALAVFEEGELQPLADAARAGMDTYAAAFFEAMNSNPKVMAYLPYVLYRTLGPELPDGMAGAASLWGLCQMYAMGNADDVRRAGHEGDGFGLGNALFEAVLNGKSGVIVSSADPEHGSNQWRKESGKVELGMGEMLGEWATLPEYRLPERTDEFPLLLAAGERRLYTANTAIRDPAWMKSNNPSSLAISPVDAGALGIEDAATARLVTKRGSVNVLVEIDDRMQPGTISLPNGLGLNYPDAAGRNEVFGVAPNELTDAQDRDEWVGTPWHKHVRARLEPLAG